jgi:hypothetical protein
MNSLEQDGGADVTLTSRQLKRWLAQTGRQYILLDSSDLVDALEAAHGWPAGAEHFQRVVFVYREHRGRKVAVTLSDGSTRNRTDVLELDELKAARTWIDQQIKQQEEN